MSKANEKSLKAKAYINGQVNKFREERRKTSDEEARKQLAENFRKTTSSKEYQEQLKIVHEDTDTIIKYAKRKKWWDITSKELKDTKTEFYGKNMNLEFWEDFEKLDLEKKVDYIFEKFWDTDYAADLIRDLLIKSSEARWIYDIDHITPRRIFEKFWLGPVSLTLIFGTKLGYYFKDEGQVFENITENTLTPLIKLDNRQNPLSFRCIVNSCKDWSIWNHEILDVFMNNKIRHHQIPFEKISIEWQKYLVDSFLIKWEYEKLLDKGKIKNAINLWNNIDVVNYICTWVTQDIIDTDENPLFFGLYFVKLECYHKTIANMLIQKWRIDIVKNNIDYFTWLTEEEKAEILWNTELEDRLNREKFDADLVKLRELWEKLWFTVKVEKKKE